MNNLTSIKSNPIFNDSVLLVVRILVGFGMISHGYPKIQMLLESNDIKFFNFLGLSPSFSLALAVFSEFICSIFVILGLFTRLATFFLIITMFIASFVVHSGDPFAQKELSLLYLATYLIIFAFGAGGFSIDGMINKGDENGRKW